MLNKFMKKKILIIEDDSILQKAVKITLEDAGLDVIQAMDGEKGLALAKSQAPDLVLLDLILPKKNGWDVLKQIKDNKEINDIPVLVFTVYEKEDSIAECMSLGARGYFLKSDYSLKEIVDKVKEVLAESRA